MISALRKNERLVRDGETNLRAPDGTPIHNVPTYKVMNVRDADPNKVVLLKEGEALELQGIEALRDEDGAFLPSTPLYRKVRTSEVNPKTKLSQGDMDNCDAFVVGTMVEIFGQCMEELKALDRCTKPKKEAVNT